MPTLLSLGSGAFILSLGLSLTANGSPQVTPCVARDFKTEMVKEACMRGGQAAAKDEMKQFMKNAKIKTCETCHTKLAPRYELKPDGLTQFRRAGGK